jgi:hypothetical protein
MDFLGKRFHYGNPFPVCYAPPGKITVVCEMKFERAI